MNEDVEQTVLKEVEDKRFTTGFQWLNAELIWLFVYDPSGNYCRLKPDGNFIAPHSKPYASNFAVESG